MPSLREEVYAAMAQNASQELSLKQIQRQFNFSDTQEIQTYPLEYSKDWLEELTDNASASKKRKEGAADEADAKAKRKGAKKADIVDDEESEGFNNDEFTDIRDLFKNFSKGLTKDAKKAKKRDSDGEDDADDNNGGSAEKGKSQAGSFNPFSEDPVQQEFELKTNCSTQDKEKEKAYRMERKKQLRQLIDKLRKIQDSLDKNNLEFKEQIRF